MPRSASINEKPDLCSIDWTIVSAARYGSGSSQASQTSGDICRICHCESDPHNPLLTPCYCSGSLKYVHQSCLQQWLTASETSSCELCKFPFIMHSRIKPLNEWKSLDMSGVERRRLFCAILFHVAAALCVIWSLCVLIERAADEVRKGQIGWPFWTKLVVVTVGLTGGVVFMYIQCKQYLNLCNRWRARNRILLIQNAPEKVPISNSPGPIRYPGNANVTDASSNSASMYRTMDFYDGGMHGQAQVIANIESEREWILDDVSQVSFKPCRQGSGSLTPFHDSIHNMFDQQTNKSACSGSTTSNKLSAIVMTPPLEDPPSSLQIRCLDSAVFIENSDILGDKNNTQGNGHRHSSVLLSPCISDHHLNNVQEPGTNKLTQNARRYSDTIGAQPPTLYNMTDILGPEVRHNTTPNSNQIPITHNAMSSDVTSHRQTGHSTGNPLNYTSNNDTNNVSPSNHYNYRFKQKSLEDVLEPKQSDIFKSMPNLITSDNTDLTDNNNRH
uniref:CSON005075 protein n=2 Tax=Culicoides sonorensis TaxID=179676 RepID=A0A336MSI5_CULSO